MSNNSDDNKQHQIELEIYKQKMSWHRRISENLIINPISNTSTSAAGGTVYIPTPSPYYIILTFQSFNNLNTYLPSDYSAVETWNNWLELPDNGNPFTSLEINNENLTIKLIGGYNINLVDSAFPHDLVGTDLVSIVDSGCIVSVSDNCFGIVTEGQFNSYLTNVDLPICESIGNYAFKYCYSLTNLNIPNCLTLGSDTSDNSVFYGIIAASPSVSITATVSNTLFTSNDGGIEGDLLFLINNNYPNINGYTQPILELISLNVDMPMSMVATINVESVGNDPDAILGLAWSLDPNPTINDSTYEFNNIDLGEHIHNINVYDTYYVRAYIINKLGTFYSNELSATAYLCLAKGTKIELSSGKMKAIEDINYDDTLSVWNFDLGIKDESKPLWIKETQTAKHYNLLKFSDGSELKTINQHRIFNNEKGMFTYPMSTDTPIGTTTFNNKGEKITLVSKELIWEEIEYYNIITDKHINIFSDNILTSCRYNNIYPISDMKFTKDNRELRSREEFANISDKYYNGLRLSEQTFDVKDVEKYISNLISLEKVEVNV